ncbi:FUSC family protein [Halorhabdus amylolytica]|uniref:hypothetical protein n=1 Tax=Halorhabdus amylolytica TaxID=2559573 RepID=UPI0010AAEA19|nr:hypothetical protein [Halorhabdus amylolytica]
MSVASGPHPDWTVEYTERLYSSDPALDIDGDGSPEASVNGKLGPSESVTRDIDPSLSDESWTIMTANGPIDISATIEERTVPNDVSVSVNGNTLGTTGQLNDGETTQLTGDKAWVTNGSNSVTVSTGSVSADAPAMRADLEYSHRASNQVSVSYNTTAFEERYNLSYTYADATADAAVTIPFQSDSVSAIKSVVYRVDGGEWGSVAAENLRFNGTTVDVYLSDEFGEELPSGATVDVEAVGRKIEVAHGEVTITDPSKPGESLDTELRIENRTNEFHVNVGTTADGRRVHYAYSDDYPTSDYAVIEADGDQKLYLPESKDGDTFRVKYLKTMVEPKTGDVRVDVLKPGTNPKLDIGPGPGGQGDQVEVRYYRAQSGIEYILNSLSRDVVLDSDTANSPATFVDDDSDETWRILEDNAQVSDDGSGGGNSIGPVPVPKEASGLPWLWIAAGLVTVAGLGIAITRMRGGTASTSSSGLGGSVAVWIGRTSMTITKTSLSVGRSIASNRTALAGLGALAVVGGLMTGVIPISSDIVVLIVAAAVPLAAFWGMRQVGFFSWSIFAVSIGLFGIGVMEVLSPGVIDSLVSALQDYLGLVIILAGVGAYLWYRQRSGPDEVNKIEIEAGGNDSQ